MRGDTLIFKDELVRLVKIFVFPMDLVCFYVRFDIGIVCSGRHDVRYSNDLQTMHFFQFGKSNLCPSGRHQPSQFDKVRPFFTGNQSFFQCRHYYLFFYKLSLLKISILLPGCSRAKGFASTHTSPGRSTTVSPLNFRTRCPRFLKF